MKEKKAIVTIVVALVLAVVVVIFGVGSSWFTNLDIKAWFDSWGRTQVEAEAPDTTDNTDIPGNPNYPETPGNQDNFETPDNSEGGSGSAITDTVANGIELLSAELPRTAYAANGVSEQADSAYTLTAIITPSYAVNPKVDWSILWKNANSEFARGKNVNSYGTIKATEDGALNAVFECKQDFGEPILIRVTSRENSAITAICEVNYYQRVKSCTYKFYYDGEEMTTAPAIDGNGVYKLDYLDEPKQYTVEVVPVYSNYTLQDEFSIVADGTFSSTFGYAPVNRFTEISMTAGLTGGEPEMSSACKSWCDSVYGIACTEQLTSTSVGVINRALEYYFSNASKADFALSDKQHPRYLAYSQAINKLYKSTSTTYVTLGNAQQLKDVRAEMEEYIPIAFTYDGNVAISSFNDFYQAVKLCNGVGAGVKEFTVTINGTYSEYSTVLKLSFNDELLTSVRNIYLPERLDI